METHNDDRQKLYWNELQPSYVYSVCEHDFRYFSRFYLKKKHNDKYPSSSHAFFSLKPVFFCKSSLNFRW